MSLSTKATIAIFACFVGCEARSSDALKLGQPISMTSSKVEVSFQCPLAWEAAPAANVAGENYTSVAIQPASYEIDGVSVAAAMGMSDEATTDEPSFGSAIQVIQKSQRQISGRSVWFTEHRGRSNIDDGYSHAFAIHGVMDGCWFRVSCTVGMPDADPSAIDKTFDRLSSTFMAIIDSVQIRRLP
jgi:hypothetical protein